MHEIVVTLTSVEPFQFLGKASQQSLSAFNDLSLQW